jgi:hypothetical protein
VTFNILLSVSLAKRLLLCKLIGGRGEYQKLNSFFKKFVLPILFHVLMRISRMVQMSVNIDTLLRLACHFLHMPLCL